MSQNEENESEGIVNDDGILDAKHFAKPGEQPPRMELDPLEKEEREKAKLAAEPAPKGKYVANCDMKVDGKRLKKGDPYEGKLYPGMVADKTILPIEAWTNR